MSKIKIGINGFGRIGRLAFRAAHGHPQIEVVHVNEPKGGVEAAAHLLTFDSVHGRWPSRQRGSLTRTPAVRWCAPPSNAPGAPRPPCIVTCGTTGNGA